MNVKNLQESIASTGPKEVAAKIVEDVQKNGVPANFSIADLFEAYMGERYVEGSEVRNQIMSTAGGLNNCRAVEATKATGFNYVTSNVMFSKVMEGYNSVPSVLDNLVSPMNSQLRHERMVGFTAMDGPEAIGEGEEYPSVNFTDRGTEGPEPEKRGRMLEITDEALMFDRTGQLLARAQQFGKKMADDREERGIQSIEDGTADLYAFYPLVNGTPTRTALYRAAAAGTAWYNKTVNALSSATTANPLVDWSSLQAAWLLFKDMTDESGAKISITPRDLLVPYDLVATASYILNGVTTEDPNTTLGASADKRLQQHNSASTISAMLPGGLRLISSVYLAEADDWYIGDFKSQFYEHIIMPTQVRPMVASPNRDIVAAFGARRKSRVFASDDKHVIKNFGA